MPAKPAAFRAGRCTICRWPCHVTSPSCRKCEQVFVMQIEAFLMADGRPTAH